MYVITDVKVIEIENDIYYNPLGHKVIPAKINSKDTFTARVDVETEIVRGRKFYHSKHGDIILAMPKEIEDKIGFPFEMYDVVLNNLSEVSRQLKETNRLFLDSEKELNKLRKSSFFKRLKFLFTGIK